MGTEVSLALQRRILARRDVYFLHEYTPSSWDILKCFGSTTINLVGADKFIRHVCSIFFKLSTDLVRSSARQPAHLHGGVVLIGKSELMSSRYRRVKIKV